MHFPPIPDVPAYVGGRSFAVVMAAFLGAERDGRHLLLPLRRLGADRDSFAMVARVVLGDLAMDPYEPLPFQSGHDLLESRSASYPRSGRTPRSGPRSTT